MFSLEFDVYNLIYMIRIRTALYHCGHRIAECQTQILFILFHFVEYIDSCILRELSEPTGTKTSVSV